MAGVISRDEENGDGKSPAPPKRLGVKAWHVVFLVLVVCATIGLAYWQWTRFQSGSGTFQNLGYAFQWPLFGIFAVYAYRTGMKLENQAAEAQAAADDPDFLFQADLKEFGEEVTRIDDDFLPSRPQIDVETFNELNRPRRIRPEDNPHQQKD